MTMRTVIVVVPAVVTMMTKMTIMAGAREGEAEEIMVLQVVGHAGDLAL
jgi:hypothetical protein